MKPAFGGERFFKEFLRVNPIKGGNHENEPLGIFF
jgi:hypothetical protein